MIRVLALVPNIFDKAPGQRYRLEQWAPRLRELGVLIEYEPFESPELNTIIYSQGKVLSKAYWIAGALCKRISLIRKIHNYDLVYIFRESALLGPAFIERWLHRLGVPMVFDFDDAVFLSNFSPSNRTWRLLKCFGKTRTACRLAAHVMAGNRYLADYALKVNKNVTIIPTTIDTDKYTTESNRVRSNPLTIGWTGSHSTVPHLNTLRKTLINLAKEEIFRLRVIGEPQYAVDGIDVEAIPWKAATEVADLLPVDIGIMPVPDSPWNRGKCGCKALQYMGLGIPTVCSPVGVNTEIIRDGENGYLASTEEEWINKLKLLMHSPELRARIGAAGRATVESQYSAAVQAPRVNEVFRSAIRGMKTGN